MKTKYLKSAFILTTVFCLKSIADTEQMNRLVTDSQLVHFIEGIKTMQINESKLDDVAALLGQPNTRNKKNQYEEWIYSFEIISDKDGSELKKINEERDATWSQQDPLAETKILKEMSKLDGDCPEYYKLRERRSVIRNKKNQITSKMEELGNQRNIILQKQRNKIRCIISFNAVGRLASIDIEKLTNEGKETVYDKRDNVNIDQNGQKSENTKIPSAEAPNLSVVTVPPDYSKGGKIMDSNDALAKADAGDARAQAIVSIYYALGYKTEKDLEKAATYALKSAAQKNPLGIFQVGVFREQGIGMKQDKAQAHKLMADAFDGLNALNGDPYALYDLGYIALAGIGVSQDTTEAGRLIKKSAEMGYAPAQKLYAMLLEKGVGVSKDNLEAERYTKLYQSQISAQ